MEFFTQYGVDFVLLIILLINILDSMRKGFFKCILSLVCVIAALAAAMMYSQTAAEWSYDNLLNDYVIGKVEEAMPDGFDSRTAAVTVQTTIDVIPEFLANQLKEIGIDISSVSESIAQMQLSAEDTAEQISQQIIRPGALVLLRMICYILIFLAVRFVLGLLTGFFGNITKLPILKQVNKWFGAVLGAVKGVVLIFVLSVLINGFASIVQDTGEFSQAIENSRICAMVNEFELSDINFDALDFNKTENS